MKSDEKMPEEIWTTVSQSNTGVTMLHPYQGATKYIRADLVLKIRRDDVFPEDLSEGNHNIYGL
jgi:hypothetical protein